MATKSTGVSNPCGKVDSYPSIASTPGLRESGQLSLYCIHAYRLQLFHSDTRIVMVILDCLCEISISLCSPATITSFPPHDISNLGWLQRILYPLCVHPNRCPYSSINNGETSIPYSAFARFFFKFKFSQKCRNLRCVQHGPMSRYAQAIPTFPPPPSSKNMISFSRMLCKAGRKT